VGEVVTVTSVGTVVSAVAVSVPSPSSRFSVSSAVWEPVTAAVGSPNGDAAAAGAATAVAATGMAHAAPATTLRRLMPGVAGVVLSMSVMTSPL
jgi:type IV secretory pathway VirB2 component (pilin)